MKTITKTALAGGAALLGAYLLAGRARSSPRRAGEDSLIASEAIRRRYERLPLKAHRFLAGIPLHSLDYAELAGGREAMTVDEIGRAAGLDDLGRVELGFATKALFGLRTSIGRALGWDEVPQLVEEVSYLRRLSAAERAASLVPPGETRGISRVLYCRENEMLLEIVNRTVHCFWVVATERTTAGYALYNAVYVKRLNWRTPIYMTLISPVLQRIVYPAIGESVRRNWEQAFPRDRTFSHAEQEK